MPDFLRTGLGINYTHFQIYRGITTPPDLTIEIFSGGLQASHSLVRTIFFLHFFIFLYHSHTYIKITDF
jgi:hypothetical protein